MKHSAIDDILMHNDAHLRVQFNTKRKDFVVALEMPHGFAWIGSGKSIDAALSDLAGELRNSGAA